MNLAELTRIQIRALMANAVIEGKGTCEPPEFELPALCESIAKSQYCSLLEQFQLARSGQTVSDELLTEYKRRADAELDAKSDLKRDVYLMVLEIGRINASQQIDSKAG